MFSQVKNNSVNKIEGCFSKFTVLFESAAKKIKANVKMLLPLPFFSHQVIKRPKSTPQKLVDLLNLSTFCGKKRI